MNIDKRVDNLFESMLLFQCYSIVAPCYNRTDQVVKLVCRVPVWRVLVN